MNLQIPSQTVWNYDHLYEHIRDDISAADLAAVNEESIFVSDHANISSYPAFGFPVEIGDALVTAGFDIVEQANNHVFDKGITRYYRHYPILENQSPGSCSSRYP